MMKRGPKVEPFLEGLKPRTYHVDDLTQTMLLVLGDGNASKAIRDMARYCYDLYQADRFNPGSKTAPPVVPTPSAAAAAPEAQPHQPAPTQPGPSPRGGSRKR